MNGLLFTFAYALPRSSSDIIPELVLFGVDVFSIILMAFVAVMALVFVVAAIISLNDERKQKKATKAASSEKKAIVSKITFEQSVGVMPLFIGITALLAFLVKLLRITMEDFNDFYSRPVDGFISIPNVAPTPPFPFALILIPIAFDIAALVFGCLKKRGLAKSFFVVAIAATLMLYTVSLYINQ